MVDINPEQNSSTYNHFPGNHIIQAKNGSMTTELEMNI